MENQPEKHCNTYIGKIRQALPSTNWWLRSAPAPADSEYRHPNSTTAFLAIPQARYALILTYSIMLEVLI
jgi:hypothetical protein